MSTSDKVKQSTTGKNADLNCTDTLICELFQYLSYSTTQSMSGFFYGWETVDLESKL